MNALGTSSEAISRIAELEPVDHELEKGFSPEQLFAHNLRWALFRAHRVCAASKGRMEIRDAETAAMQGLWIAANRWDPTVGSIFLSFARWHIEAALSKRRFEDFSGIRLSEKTLKRKFSLEASGAAKTAAEKMLASLRVSSMDALIGSEDTDTEMTFGDTIPDDQPSPRDVAEQGDTPLDRLLTCLNESERLVLTKRYGLDDGSPMTLDQIALVIKRTRQRVEQIEKQALRRIRAFIAEQKGVW